jgi:hypothetical protein
LRKVLNQPAMTTGLTQKNKTMKNLPLMKRPATDTTTAGLVKKGVETRKGMSFTRRDKDVAEIDAALAPKNNPAGMDPDFRSELEKRRASLRKQGYTETELKARVSRAATEQAAKKGGK